MDNNDNSKDKTTTTDDNDVEIEQQQDEEENPNSNNGSEQEVVPEEEPNNTNRSRGGGGGTGRTPFTNLSQVDADLALARTLQEQERAYMMLRMNTDGSDFGSWEGGSYLHDDDDEEDEDEDEEEDEDHFDATDIDDDDDDVHIHDDEDEQEDHHVVEDDTDAFSSDEAYARALQDAEEREMAARLLALAAINDPTQVEDPDDHATNSQDTWEEIDPDELSYEELLALGEVIGTESRGLSTDTIASLPTVIYKSGSSQNGSNDSCVICRLDYEDGETLTVLSCKHSYHSDCINNWLKINKVCPVCNAEVSTSGNS